MDLFDVPDITQEELKFASKASKKVQEILLPVPYFIFSPYSIHDQNFARVNIWVSLVLSDRDNPFPNSDRLRTILIGIASLEVWKRGWLLRIQWFLQIIALLLMWRVLCR